MTWSWPKTLAQDLVMAQLGLGPGPDRGESHGRGPARPLFPLLPLDETNIADAKTVQCAEHAVRSIARPTEAVAETVRRAGWRP